MKTKLEKSIWLISLVCIVLGFFFIKAFHGESPGAEVGEVNSIKTIERLLVQKKALEERKKEMDGIIAEHEGKISSYENTAAQNDAQLQATKDDLQNTRLMAGLLPVEGPGIEIILSDRKRDTILSNNPYIMKYYIVHDSDMLNVINELREAGAEAIAVNGTRIMATSRISCGGPTINVGKSERFAPPFVIHAIGDPNALLANFQREDSIYQDLIAWGLEFQIRKLDRIEIPRYLGETEYTFAKAIQEGE
jgi:uncharacterized protein YlxW (UPF0749 family)